LAVRRKRCTNTFPQPDRLAVQYRYHKLSL